MSQMPGTTSVLEVAKRFLALAKDDRNTLTPMQLIKLSYIAHGWMLGLYGRPLFKENVEAWPYGPVIPKLYHEIKKFRSQPVNDITAVESDLDQDEYQVDIVEQTYKKYGRMPGMQLSGMTHTKGTPWYITWHDTKNCIISNDLIEDYYHQLAKDA